MQESEASLLAVHEHLRPHICAEAADRFHKRVRRIHDPVTIVVPCVVVEVEIPIPPDRSVHLGSYNGVFADTMYAVASQRGEVDKDPAEAASIKTERSRPTRYDRSTSDAYQSRKSLKCVKIFLMEAPTCDQTSLGKKEEELEE
ncbi:hypothetical protein F2Q69_00047940 [Brassica cretica]|uniref:Uncharacterized protein n=1 Tax=Brassica cretica TaxID=69181 RepID=A0A8S9PUD3_BRACR|nr:hypothetical protein F2Q69_00047940 [Brassica cretica]